MKKINIFGLLFFYLIVIVTQYLLRHGGLNFYERLDWPDLGKFAVAIVLLGGSVTIAALASWKIFGPQFKVSTLLGEQPRYALVMFFVPIVTISAFGYANNAGINPHLAGALMGLLLMVYAICEEIGWRGFMHDAMSPLPIIIRSIVIGIAWYMWHFWFLYENSNLIEQIQLLLLLCGLSVLFSKIIEVTRSWISVGAFHCAGNITLFAGAFVAPQQQRLIMGTIILSCLILIHTLWQREIRK